MSATINDDDDDAVMAVCKRLLPELDLTYLDHPVCVHNNRNTTSKQLREMVAVELNVSPALVNQTTIDSAMLDILSEPVQKEILPRLKSKSSPPKVTKKNSPGKKRTKAKRKKMMMPKKEEKQIQKLKQYVTKCGVRKQWKREFEGLSQTEMVTRLNEILEDLGMKGTHTHTHILTHISLSNNVCVQVDQLWKNVLKSGKGGNLRMN